MVCAGGLNAKGASKHVVFAGATADACRVRLKWRNICVWVVAAVH